VLTKTAISKDDFSAQAKQPFENLKTILAVNDLVS
jgi:hypothetical protein